MIEKNESPAPAAGAPAAPAAADTDPGQYCARCEHYEYRICHKWSRSVCPVLACPSWESRREHEGLTIWELLAREG